MMLLLMALCLMVACGDNSDDNGTNRNVDGVSVSTGKKLVKMQFSQDEQDIKPMNCKIEYDSKGRLSKILFEDYEYGYDDNSNNYYFNFTGTYSSFVQIDYEMRSIRAQYKSGNVYSTGFSLNKEGYISIIDKYILKYDSNGYLIGADEPKGITTLEYDDNDLIKASLSNMFEDNMISYFITYGNTDNKGELYLRVKNVDDIKRADFIMRPNYGSMAFIIAYQSGLFGKNIKSILHLKDENEASVMFECDSKRRSFYGKFSCVYQ